MRIKIKESFSALEVPQVDESTKTKLLEESNKYTLRPQIEAIHAGLTRNKTFYQADKLQGDPALESGVYSWTRPYPKPLIKNHDTCCEDPLGRIHDAYYVRSSSNGNPAIMVVPTITDQAAIEKILDGRYVTVSIGAETDSVTCSICGTNLLEEEWGGLGHEHQRGQKYDGKECYWIIGNLWFDELSFVNVPADKDAGVVNPGKPIKIGEDIAQETNEEELTLDLNLGKFVNQEGQIVDKEFIVLEFKSGPTGSGNEEDNEMPQKTQDGNATTGPVNEMTIEEAKDEIERLKTLVDSSETEKQNLTEKANKVETLETNIAERDATIQTLEAEKQVLIENVAILESEVHKGLAERVVDIKISLRKIKPEEREQAIADHTGRTKESLKDSLVDLLDESNRAVPLLIQAIEKVSNPGQVTEYNSDDTKSGDYNLQTDADVVKDLLGPKKFRQ